jgi:hypothetical protein
VIDVALHVVLQSGWGEVMRRPTGDSLGLRISAVVARALDAGAKEVSTHTSELTPLLLQWLIGMMYSLDKEPVLLHVCLPSGVAYAIRTAALGG